jgi:hypothetical protein
MVKSFTVFTALLIVSIFITGCSQVTPEPVKSPAAEPPKVKPPNAEPLEVESPNSQPPEHKLAEAKPPQPSSVPAVAFHDKCADILNNFVDHKGKVDYKTLKRKRVKLKKLLDEFDELDPNEYNSWSKEDKISFWINAYNVQMLKIIVENYPIKSSRVLRLLWPPNSIRHIRGIWNKYKFIVMDEQFTLSEMESRFFRQEFDEPRVFFALSQASLSGPPLRNEPYYGHKLYEQLDDQAKRFFSNPLAFRIDRNTHTVHLSAILQPAWYGAEFRAVLNFITNYLSEQDVYFLETGNYSVEYISYNWTLNE